MNRVYMRFPGGRSKALTLSYDDGVEHDKRLIAIMRKYGLKGTFNINSGLYAQPDAVSASGAGGSIAGSNGALRGTGGDGIRKSRRRMTLEEARSLYCGSGMEVACHTLTHVLGGNLPSHVSLQQIAEDRKNLEEQFQCLVRGMAYPGGHYDDQVIEMMKYAGIVYGRTDRWTHDFALPEDWYRLTGTCHHGDPKLMELASQFVEKQVRYDPILFYLWGHSYEFEEQDNWQIIEQFASFMGGREEIWYASNIEIYDYRKAFESLVYSMDGRCVYNPSATELFLETGGEGKHIGPGEFVKIG